MEHPLDLRISNLMNFGKVRIFPGEEFDYLNAGKELLKKFGTLVGRNRGFLAETKHEAYEYCLDRRCYNEDSKTSQSAWAQVDQEDDQTDNQLDWGSPAHVKEMAGGVDARNVSRDVVHQFSVGVDVPSASRERESLVVDRGDQPRTQQDPSSRGAVEKVVRSEGG